MKKSVKSARFSALDVVLSSCVLLALAALLLPTFRSASGETVFSGSSRGGAATVVTVRMESLRQQMEHFRMRLVDAYDRRFNDSVPVE